jgi:nucleoside-diphosphate-sugar epimerase
MTTNPRNVWVLGATGYIGQALLKHLALDKCNRIHLLLHKRTNFPHLEAYNTFQASLGHFDPEWIKQYPPDVVFHLARPAGSNFLMREIRSFIGEHSNARLARLFTKAEPPPLIVYVSGSLVYGQIPPGEIALEDRPHNPGSFAKAYYRNEKPWLKAAGRGTLDIRFARPAWIVGPGSWFRKYFWDYYLQSGKVPCYGDGSQQMSLIGLDDCAAAIDALSIYGHHGQMLNLFAMDALHQIEFSMTMALLLQTDVEMVSLAKAKQMYGRTVAKALIMSIPLGSMHKQTYECLPIRLKTLEDLLDRVIGLLKNEQGVFAKAP